MRGSFSSLKSALPALFAVSLFTAACGDDDDLTQPNGTVAIAAGQASATVAAGSTVNVPITVTRTNFGGAVSLTAENLPTGVTVTFSPASIASGSSTSTMAISASNTATAGTNTITIRSSGSGVTSSTTTLPITVTTSSITLVSGANAVLAAQGSSASIPIVITRNGSFTGAVNLVAENLPNGVTATFSPATLTSTDRVSTLTLTAAAGATAGATPITIRATGTGIADQTQLVNFTVNAGTTAGFGVSAAPAALVIRAGQSGTSTVTISRQAAFAGNIQFALEGAPTGVSATITPNPAAAGTSTITVNTTATTTPGTYQLTLRGTSAGATERTAAITLVVLAP